MKIEDAIKRYESWAEDDRIDVLIRNEHRQIADWLKELNAGRPQEFIPCFERLPEKKAQKYLIYYQDYLNGGYDYAVTTYLRTPYGWEFEVYNESNNCEAIAWMPLPKPWKGADDEDS